MILQAITNAFSKEHRDKGTVRALWTFFTAIPVAGIAERLMADPAVASAVQVASGEMTQQLTTHPSFIKALAVVVMIGAAVRASQPRAPGSS